MCPLFGGSSADLEIAASSANWTLCCAAAQPLPSSATPRKWGLSDTASSTRRRRHSTDPSSSSGEVVKHVRAHRESAERRNPMNGLLSCRFSILRRGTLTHNIFLDEYGETINYLNNDVTFNKEKKRRQRSPIPEGAMILPSTLSLHSAFRFLDFPSQ